MTDQSAGVSRPTRRSLRQRVVLVSGIFAYIACFQWMYVYYLYPMWDYFGFHYEPRGAGYLLFAWTLSAVPSLWMPIELLRPSQLAYWVLYITVFIPSMFAPLYAGLNSPAEVSVLMLTLFLGFALTGSSYLLPLGRFPSLRISRPFFWKVFGCVFVALSVWLIVVFRHHISIVSFSDVYDLRNAAEDIAEGSLVNFAYMGLAGAINPFLIGCGLYYRRNWMFLAGALGQLLVYSVGGTKGSILSILFVPGIYFLLKVGRLPFALKFSGGVLALLGGTCASYILAGYEPGPLHTMVLFVVLMRILSGNGLIMGWYYDFFQRNPLTYMSHIRVVRWFVHYPYANYVGVEVGSHYSGDPTLDATTSFWATDGIGGFGLPGLLFISVFCTFVFWVLDSASQRHDPRLAAAVTAYAAYNLANISIFTSLYSGGFALLIFALYVMPPKAGVSFEPRKQKVRSSSVLGHPRGGGIPIPG
jgi:hypothetical protein